LSNFLSLASSLRRQRSKPASTLVSTGLSVPRLDSPAFLAIWSAADEVNAPLERVARCADHFFELDDAQLVNLSVSRNLGVASVSPRSSSFRQERIVTTKQNHFVSTHFIPALFSNPQKSSVEFVQDAARLLGDYSCLTSLPPPVGVVLHEQENDRIRIANDLSGSAKMYCFESSKTVIISNRAELISFALNRTLGANIDAWRQQSSFDWIVDDQCYNSELRMLEPGYSITMTPSGVAFNETHSFANLIKDKNRTSSIQQVSFTGALKVIDDALMMSGGQVASVGLTGGRDSRTIAALLRHVEGEFTFHTGIPPNLEAVLAKELVEASRVKMPWETRLQPGATKPATMSFADRSWLWFNRTGGDTWPSFVRNDFTGSRSASLVINGGGGEVLRGNFYTRADLENEDDRVAEFVEQRGRYHPFLTVDARSAAKAASQQIIDSGRDAGLSGLHLLDWFYLRSKQRRRVPLPFSFTIYPLFTADLLAQAFLLPPSSKLSATFQRTLVDELAPEWNHISYFADIADQYPSDQTDKTETKPYFWENGERRNLIEVLEVGLAASKGIYVPTLLDTYRTVQRSDRSARLLQATADRIMWRVGFEENQRRVEDSLRRAGQSGPNSHITRIF
jgi:hypothetical protein